MPPRISALLSIAFCLSCRAPSSTPIPPFDVGLAVAPTIAPTPAPAAPTPEDFPIWGVDVSHHQGAIDWKRVAKHPRIRFAYIKATEGTSFVDRRFQENWRHARAAGLKTGAYHYFTFCRPGIGQAKHFLKVLPSSRDALPPVVDVEFVGNCTQTPNVANVRRELELFLSAIVEARGVRPIIYVIDPAFELFVKGSERRHPLWVRGDGHQTITSSGFEWALWQFTDSGNIPGIATPVDLNAAALLEQLVRQ